jgi:hypothetical protein
MLQKALHEFGTLHALDIARPVVHLGGCHELASLRDTGDQEGLKVGAGRIDSSRVTGWTGAQDQDFDVHGVFASELRRILDGLEHMHQWNIAKSLFK